MRELLPLNLAIVRFTIASLFFGIFLLLKKGNRRIEREDIPQFLMLGFLGITFFISFISQVYNIQQVQMPVLLWQLLLYLPPYFAY